MRTALYFTPPRDHPLSQAAVSWLGRDAYGETATNGPGFDAIGPDEWASLTASPRRYGFHATIKAPFTLASGKSVADLDAALSAYCMETAPVMLPSLKLARLGSFFALIPGAPSPQLQAFAGDTVRAFELFRAALSEADIARREGSGLSDEQKDNLRRWGYPYVFEQFRFHMTLTGPVPEADQPRIEALLRRHFAAFIGKNLSLDALSLFVEPQRGDDFTVYSAHALRCP